MTRTRLPHNVRPATMAYTCRGFLACGLLIWLAAWRINESCGAELAPTRLHLLLDSRVVTCR